MRGEADAELRAALNEELGFYPASLDPDSIAEARRANTEQAERLARFDRMYGPGGSHRNRWKHLKPKTGG